MTSLTTSPIETFAQHGYANFGTAVDTSACADFSRTVRGERCHREGIFIEEAAFRANPVIPGNNPRPGRNYLEAHDDSFVERLPRLQQFLDETLGSGYQLLVKKVVCSLPHSWVPRWVHEEIERSGFRNLNPYVKDPLKDVTYFIGQDWHQDLIDYKDRTADFLTAYLYLDDVTPDDSPLMILPDSHLAGADIFPHNLQRTSPGQWIFTPDGRPSTTLRQMDFIGPAGSLYAWHACVLHATLPNTAVAPRVSLRYLFGKAPGAAPSVIDDVNQRIGGALFLERTRAYKGQEVLGDSLGEHFPEIAKL